MDAELLLADWVSLTNARSISIRCQEEGSSGCVELCGKPPEGCRLLGMEREKLHRNELPRSEKFGAGGFLANELFVFAFAFAWMKIWEMKSGAKKTRSDCCLHL